MNIDKMNDYKEGEVYYCIKYSDGKRQYPIIDTFVFLGRHFSPPDNEDIWYFQPANSFAKFGSVLENPNGDRVCLCLPENKLDDMSTLNELVIELKTRTNADKNE